MRPVVSAARCRAGTAIAVAAVLMAAGCSSGGGDDVEPAQTFETMPPTDGSAAADPTTAPPDTSGATSTPTTVGAPDTAPDDEPLVEPAVDLVEIGAFDRPVDVSVRPLDPRLFVVSQTGTVTATDDEGSDVVLDVSDRITTSGGEQGLLGLAFHPTLDLAYVDFTDTDGDTVVAEYAVDPESGRFDTGSYREVLTVDQPYENHNGGKLVFGPDELLYISLGDGGSADDPGRNGLDLATRLGKILRIDPVASDGQPFRVPADNPFVDTDGADPTIWSYGLRNPWRFSFDPTNGDLWIADVGQNEFEEIDHAAAVDGADAGKGLNFGWSAIEGDEPFNADQDAAGATPPVFVYSHDTGCSVSGGAVASPDAIGGLAGWYVFGDYCTGDIWALDPGSVSEGADTDARVVTIGNLPGLAAISAGVGGDLYAISNSGTIARFTPN